MSNISPPHFATGLGYDVHPFVEGRRLVLGGVTIPHDRGLQGHSDADVLLHALCDALLGAAGLPDIGHYFPNDEAKWKDADSRVLLREVGAKLAALNWQIGNVDVVVVAEAPKIMPHIKEMKERIGQDLTLEHGRIGIKATTNEGMGFVGRGEGIAVLATAMLYR